MASLEEREGIRVLDDFICDAILAPDIPQADPTDEERYEELTVAEEFQFDASGEVQPTDRTLHAELLSSHGLSFLFNCNGGEPVEIPL